MINRPSTKQIASYLSEYYDIQAKMKLLAGEVDYNYHLQTTDNQQYLLKISRPNTSLQSIDFQAKILQYLEEQTLDFEIPKVVLTKEGNAWIETEEGQYLRLQTWVEGKMVDDWKRRSPELLQSWGKAAAQLNRALQNFDHPEAHRFYKWNPSETLYSKKYTTHFISKKQQEIARYFWELFEKQAQPKLENLRKGVNYNDAHELNFLSQNGKQISGVIDFGDALYTQIINELAIACAYACMNANDPIEAARQVIKGFHEVLPLQKEEIEVLFLMIAARLMITVANAAWNKHQEPDNEYLLISEKPAWDLLEKLYSVSPSYAHYCFRAACDWEACPKYVAFQRWLENAENSLHSVIDLKGKTSAYLDLSVGSLDLGNNSNFDTIAAFNKTIERLLAEKEVEIGVGGYGEVRPFYSTDAYEIESNEGAQWRTVHLGFDVWAKAGTPVFAPLDGIVHSFQDNAAERDYGPTIILEHQVNEELTFYTLYGHLSKESLEGLCKGKAVPRSTKIATIGSPPVNGNWPPHLHFQVILDMLGKQGDFPGVAFPHEQEIWKSICPDPTTFFKYLPSKSRSYELPAQQIFETRQKHLGKSLSLSYKHPLHIVRGYKQYLYDQNARRYLDTANNVPHVGHQHPRVVDAAQRQLEVLNTNTRYLYGTIVQYAEELLATFPPELSVVHFVNSGSEANELALRMAKIYSGQKDMLAVEVGYHGNTNACIDVSSYKFDSKGGQGAPETTHLLPIPDIFRGKHRDVETAGEQYAAYAQKIINDLQKQGKGIAGVIVESILSCGGQIVLPPNYLKELYKITRAAGGVCIADEVQVGMGRVGEHFWGFELQGVVPDIVTLGKPIGNGHPLGAVVCTEAVANAFNNGMEYFNTFGGNPVSCAVGREVLKVVQDENLQQHALEVGNYLKVSLQQLQKQFPIIGDVRGHGLFLGMELIKDQEKLTPADTETSYLSNRMKELGILMGTDGPFHNVLKIKPAMCFSKENADVLVGRLEQVFGEIKT
ncbi:MAG: aminotransferase class III-fold pyridoxal phosphate-dependent enzyme [Bacteroidota bacterium]